MVKISDKLQNVVTMKPSMCTERDAGREVVLVTPVMEELGDEPCDTLFVLPRHPRGIPEVKSDISRQVLIAYRGEDEDEDNVSDYHLWGVVVHQDFQVARILEGETVDSE